MVCRILLRNMDNLDDMPIQDDFEMSDEENEVMRELFSSDGNISESKSDKKITWGEALKVTGYGVLLFAVLANPWINMLLSKIPKFDNPIILFCAKLFLFGMSILLLSKLT